jgi:hypothetical protein
MVGCLITLSPTETTDNVAGMFIDGHVLPATFEEWQRKAGAGAAQDERPGGRTGDDRSGDLLGLVPRERV